MDYIIYQLNNKTAANNLLDEIKRQIDIRAYEPDTYEKYYSTRKRKNTYYRIYVKNCTIFYVIRGNCMEIRKILYSKRNIDKFI